MILILRKRSGILLGAVVLFFLFPITNQRVHGTDFTEDQIKAVYLFNFAEFIRWPESAFSEHPEAFHFCALNEQSAIIRMLKKVIDGKTAGGRKLVFRRINGKDDWNGCQLLYFHADEQSKLAGLLPELKGRNLLTVGDKEDFVKNGGMIGIARQSKNLHLFINVQHLKQANLKASAKLLRLASVVDGS